MITRETIAAIGQKAADCPAQATIFMTEEIEELARVALATDDRTNELLRANNAEVAKRRAAMTLAGRFADVIKAHYVGRLDEESPLYFKCRFCNRWWFRARPEEEAHADDCLVPLAKIGASA